MFRTQADWTFILPSGLPTKELRHLPRKMPPQTYHISQYVVLRGGISLGKGRSTFAESSDGRMKDQSAYALNTIYNLIISHYNTEVLQVHDLQYKSSSLDMNHLLPTLRTYL
jgi:hypothetical protein